MTVSKLQFPVCFLRVINVSCSLYQSLLNGSLQCEPQNTAHGFHAQESLAKNKVSSFYSIISELTSPNFCYILLIRIKKVNSTHVDGDGITERRWETGEGGWCIEAQWEHWELLQKLPTPSLVPAAVALSPSIDQ